MTTVANILRSKPDRTVHGVSPATSMYEALGVMAEKNVGALLVLDDGAIVGIVTERDYARRIVLKGRSSRDTPVRDVMTSPVLYVTPEQSGAECMALMTEKRLRHLPVIQNERVIGVLSIGDLVKDAISEQRFIIDQLEHYIHR